MWLFVLPLAVVILDQFSKYIVVENMALGESIPIIEEVFHLTYILNPGAAFGMFAHNRLFFIAIAIVVIGIIIWARREILASPWEVKAGCGLFLGGAIGNLIDRARQGLVIDFFDFRIWPVFNIADIAICIGVGLIIWNLLKTELKRD
ncbi:signal peptidase II [Phascolarctobacterium sp. ET69]|uniref:signal peptidase II n=1 Tax=Phascolarctobacterium sp. ET69 TaxID=2939420 RepID=UPI002013056D|nr:signal peptidase II [Phascolarctobacterium sp. ET69]MCL1604548.1 signal peptidase II [Phascolarctobacterium sp. ET69]